MFERIRCCQRERERHDFVLLCCSDCKFYVRKMFDYVRRTRAVRGVLFEVAILAGATTHDPDNYKCSYRGKCCTRKGRELRV